MGLRRREGWCGQDDMQFDPFHPPLQGPGLRSDNLHRPRPQSQRRIPAEIHQSPNFGQRIHQSLRHGTHLDSMSDT